VNMPDWHAFRLRRSKTCRGGLDALVAGSVEGGNVSGCRFARRR
jgi:hypothetical protein